MYLAQQTNAKFYFNAVKFVLLYLDFLGLLADEISAMRTPARSEKVRCEQMPDYCNEFILFYVEERLHIPVMPPRDFLIEVLEDFCNWLRLEKLSSRILLRQLA